MGINRSNKKTTLELFHCQWLTFSYRWGDFCIKILSVNSSARLGNKKQEIRGRETQLVMVVKAMAKAEKHAGETAGAIKKKK